MTAIQQKKILMIDDEPERITAHVEALEDEGYHVARAAQVDEGLQLITQQDFDLLIMDLLMAPSRQLADRIKELDLRESGFWLYQQIREQLGKQHIPIIFFSGVRDPKIANKIQNYEKKYHNKVRIQRKPMLPTELIDLVERMIGTNDD